MQPRSLGGRPGRDERVFHVTKSGYLSSGNLGSTGLFEVSAQNKASKLWKQCSGVQTSWSGSPAWSAGLGGIRDIASVPKCSGRVRPGEKRYGQEQESRFTVRSFIAASTACDLSARLRSLRHDTGMYWLLLNNTNKT